MAAKIEYHDLRQDLNLKIDFARIDIENFWVSLPHEYPILSRKALSFLIQCFLTYCGKVGFSAMISIKTKYRNKLVMGNDIKYCLSSIVPRFDRLIAQQQHHRL